MLSTKYIIILIIIIIAILFLYKKQENVTSTDSGKTLSDEALQIIASVYNKQNMVVTNLNATNNIITPKISSPLQKYSLAMQDDGNLVVYDSSGNMKWDSNSSKISQNNYEAGKIFSSDKKFVFMMQTDGNPAVWDPTATNLKWAGIGNMKSMNGSYFLNMQDDGNLVVYDQTNKPKWASSSSIQYGEWARIANSTGGNSPGFVFFKG